MIVQDQSTNQQEDIQDSVLNVSDQGFFKSSNQKELFNQEDHQNLQSILQKNDDSEYEIYSFRDQQTVGNGREKKQSTKDINENMELSDDIEIVESVMQQKSIEAPQLQSSQNDMVNKLQLPQQDDYIDSQYYDQNNEIANSFNSSFARDRQSVRSTKRDRKSCIKKNK